MRMMNVEIHEGVFKASQEAGAKFLLGLDADRLLAPYYEAANLAPKKPHYGGWEAMEIRGHSFGHYLSALSMWYQTSKDEAVKAKIDYVLDQLDFLQTQDAEGYVGGVKRSVFDEVFQGDFQVDGFSLANTWVPLYNIDKLFHGLIDWYKVSKSDQAKRIVEKLGDYFLRGIEGLTDEQVQRILISEHGGMNEVLIDLYGMTGRLGYKEASIRFTDMRIIQPLIDGIDDLAGKHANTQIPKVIGALAIHQAIGEEDYLKAATYFFDTVTTKRTYVMGGNSIAEHFGPSETEPLGILTAETCNTYNMIKLALLLFEETKEAKYSHYIEQALYNHILAAQEPETGNKTYFMSTEPGHFKLYSDNENSFWCCVGSGMENPFRYHQAIYHETQKASYVNLFIDSEYKGEQIKIRQSTPFPFGNQVKIEAQLLSDQPHILKIRKPKWLAFELSFKVNEKQITPNLHDDYYELDLREQKSNITFSLTPSITVYRNREDEQKIAFLYGPLVLSSRLGKEHYPEHDSVGDHLIYNEWPTIEVAPLVSEAQPESLITCKDQNTLTFETKPIVMPGEKRYTLVPYFMLHHERYSIYHQLIHPEQYQKGLLQDKAEQENTLVEIQPGQQQPEVTYKLKEEKTKAGYSVKDNAHFRECEPGGVFSYQINDKVTPKSVEITYLGYENYLMHDENQVRKSIIYINDERLEETSFKLSELPQKRVYPINEKHLKDQDLVIKIEADEDLPSLRVGTIRFK